MRTLAQKRSEFALKKILSIKAKEIDKFDSLAASAPTQILQNGFGQTIAFWLSKKEKEKKMVEIIMEWLNEKGFIDGEISDNKKFVEYISTIDQKEYLTLQKETLALLEWVKRYAQAFLKEEKNNV